jgi:regulator of cell morphogenesis and NO signaling
MSERLDTTIIGDIVAADFRTAGIFAQFGIDFCCGGRVSLAEACRAATVNPAEVIRALDALPLTNADDDDAARWPVVRLVDHIVSVHHRYVREALPLIAGYLAKLESVHGARHPELARVSARFEAVAVELRQHMMKEEHVLFPYVVELAADGERCGPSPFGTVENPIRMMEREHREAAEGLRAIRELTGGYTPPADGCTTYAVCMAELARFERDLHRHVHLENNVLFPRAIEAESALGLRE